jgi:predicted phosphodiesterase
MKILTIGDTHLPAVHPGYLSFCRDLADKHGCEIALHIGDFADFHAISQHEKHPDAPGSAQEYESAFDMAKKWRKAFPRLMICEGNHDARIIRQAATVNIPKRFLHGYNDLWGTPGWKWAQNFTFDEVHYVHGTGQGGQYPAFNLMSKMCMSAVMGHIHSAAGIWWRANPNQRFFGMNVGCGVDDRHIAFQYGENLKVRSILSAGVVIDGVPQHVIMPVGRGEKYHRSRFIKRSAA